MLTCGRCCRPDLVEYLMIQKNVGDAWIYLTFLFYIIPQCHILFHLSDAELLGTFVGEQSPHVSPPPQSPASCAHS